MRYYVYILLDPRYDGDFSNRFCEIKNKPFYVGKGDKSCKSGSIRHLQHYKDVLKNNIKIKKNNPYKFNIIKKLYSLNYKPLFKIIFESDNENEVYKVEKEMIILYGTSNNENGILTNISSGGSGGDTFTNNPNKEIIREKHRVNAIGEKNNMYGLSLEKRPSHIAKIKGNHWNLGRKLSKKAIDASLKYRNDNLLKVVIINADTLEEVEVLTTKEVILKYNISSSSLYRSLKYGGRSKGYYIRYEDKELVFSKSKKSDYIRPVRKKGYKVVNGHIIYNVKKVYYKKNINDSIEIEFKLGVDEASKYFNICVESVRRKCRTNNTEENIFRYENEVYKFNIKKGVKRKVKMINKDGGEVIFNSITEAAKIMDGKVTSILAVCKGRNKTYKGLKYKYVN